MSIKNLKYDLTPQEIFQIFMRDYDKYTKEEINVFLEYLIGESEKYVRADKLIELYDGIIESCREKFPLRFNIVNENLDVFVNTLSKFLYESTNINVNEPIIIDENVYMNYLNHLGHYGKLLTTRLENDYIFNSCIHSRVGYYEFHSNPIYWDYSYSLRAWWHEDSNYFIDSNHTGFSNFYNKFRYLPIYLEFNGYDGNYYGWVNEKQFSNVAGVFYPLPLLSNSLFPEQLQSTLVGGDVIEWFDFSKGDFITGSFDDYDNSGKGGLESSSMIIKKDDSFILNCNLPNYIFKCYKDEGGIFDRIDNYYRDPSIWNSGYENKFPIITEYNPVEKDMSYRATPKFGTNTFWNMKGALFENDKDFMQVIKREDIKYQGDFGWMKNNFYISNFIYIPEIYIFIKFLYRYRGNNNDKDELVEEFRNLINDVLSDREPLDKLFLFILHAYTLEFEDDQFYADTKEYQELVDLENSIGIINFIKNCDIYRVIYDSWGKTFIGNNNILKNISYSNYKMIDSEKTFEYLSSYTEISSEFSGQMIDFFGIAEDITIGIPNIFWEANDEGEYTRNSLLFNTANYRCSFFYRKESDDKTHFAMIHKEGNFLKIRDSIIIFDSEKIFFVGNYQEKITIYFDPIGSSFANLKKYMTDIYPNVEKYNTLKVIDGEKNFGLLINNLNFSILIVEGSYLDIISNSNLIHNNIDLLNVIENDNFDNWLFDEDNIYKKITTDVSSKFEKKLGNIIHDGRPYYTIQYMNDYTVQNGGYQGEFIIGSNASYYDTNGNYTWMVDQENLKPVLGEGYFRGHNEDGLFNLPDGTSITVLKNLSFDTQYKIAGIVTSDSGTDVVLFVAVDIRYNWKFDYATIEEQQPFITNYNFNDDRCMQEGFPAYARVIQISLTDTSLAELSDENIEYYYNNSAIGDDMLISEDFTSGFRWFWNTYKSNLRSTTRVGDDYVKVNGFVLNHYRLSDYQSYEMPTENSETIILNRKILKKNENEMVNQDISNVTVDMLDKAFYDWNKIPFYMYKTRIGKKEMATVKGQFLTRLLENIRNNHFKQVVKEEESLIEIPVIEER